MKNFIINTLEIQINQINEISYTFDLIKESENSLNFSLLENLEIKKFKYDSLQQLEMINANTKLRIYHLDARFPKELASVSDLSSVETLIAYDSVFSSTLGNNKIKYIEFNHNFPNVGYGNYVYEHEYKFDFPYLEKIDILNKIKVLDILNLENNIEINYKFKTTDVYPIIINLKGKFNNFPIINGDLKNTVLNLETENNDLVLFYLDLLNRNDSLVPEEIKTRYYTLLKNGLSVQMDYELLKVTKFSSKNMYNSLKNRCYICKKRYNSESYLVKKACNHFIHLDCFNKIIPNGTCPECGFKDKTFKIYYVVFLSDSNEMIRLLTKK